MDITNEFLNKTLEYLNSAEAFLQKNVPAYVEELLVFDFYEAVFYSALPLVLLVITGILFYFTMKIFINKDNKFSRESSEFSGACSVIIGMALAVLLIFSAITVPENIIKAVKIKVAPRVYLVEKISSMVKK